MPVRVWLVRTGPRMVEQLRGVFVRGERRRVAGMMEHRGCSLDTPGVPGAVTPGRT